MTATEPQSATPKARLRWFQPSKGALAGLVLLVSFAAWLAYIEHEHSRRLEARRAIQGVGGKIHRKVEWKDEVEGDFLDIDMRNARFTDAEVEYVITLNPQGRLLLGSTQPTTNGLKRLRQSLPNCKIEWEPPTPDERQSPAAPDQLR